MILIAIVAAVIAATAPVTIKVAPGRYPVASAPTRAQLPLVTPGAIEPAHEPARLAKSEIGDPLSAALSTDAPWTTLAEHQRHLLIAGAVDGIAAAGSGGCLTLYTPAALDGVLVITGMAKLPARELAGRLVVINHDACPATTAVQRTAVFAKMLSDADLAAYLTGAVLGYAEIHGCPEAAEGGAAIDAASRLLLADDTNHVATTLAGPFGDACTVKPASDEHSSNQPAKRAGGSGSSQAGSALQAF